ncbi:hypothetical protein J8Z24_12295 [Pseudoalteromonas sp. SCSIO 43201]|uniref:hypothetical protein n=1 Tax=Pseudoalteromonas sp. SCSIO 43201 TaxID=2822842 RepID=UPI00207505CC|nr:hypothetical protein [Pseudoalteromonas sp. SCSIO 43201]USD27720.1 hypothetical protein J8Z24_12295 [Pseudoalteromonas sp. SCSIO 43201]
MEIYILIECQQDELSPLNTRLIEIERVKGKFKLIRSEYNYLGEGIIDAEIDEDEDGLYYFSFTTLENEPRQFICEGAENSEYIHGDILSDGIECGEFILRNITNVSLP